VLFVLIISLTHFAWSWAPTIYPPASCELTKLIQPLAIPIDPVKKAKFGAIVLVWSWLAPRCGQQNVSIVLGCSGQSVDTAWVGSIGKIKGSTPHYW